MSTQVSQKMKSFTVEEFQVYFDDLIERVENGESFIIRGNNGDAVLVPCNNDCENVDELIRIHTNHEEGC